MLGDGLRLSFPVTFEGACIAAAALSERRRPLEAECQPIVTGAISASR